MGNLSNTEGKEAQEDHNRGQKDGAKADLADQILHDTIGSLFTNDQYDEGYDHGVASQSDKD